MGLLLLALFLGPFLWLAYAGYRFLKTLGLLAIDSLRIATQRLAQVNGQWLNSNFRIREMLEQMARQAGCDVWVAPSRHASIPPDLPALMLIDDLVTSPNVQGFPARRAARANRLGYRGSHRSRLVGCASHLIHTVDVEELLRIPSEKICLVPPPDPDDGFPLVRPKQEQACGQETRRTWQMVGRDWLVHLRRAPQPRSSSTPIRRSSEVFLFLPAPLTGRAWKRTRALLAALADANRHREKPLKLTFAFHPDQTEVEDLPPGLRAEPLLFGTYSKEEAFSLLLDQSYPALQDERGHLGGYCVVSNLAALHADAWLALANTFEAPLLPDRPYGLLVGADSVPGPNLHHADLVITTDPISQNRLITQRSILPRAAHLIPPGLDLSHGLAEVQPEPMTLPCQPFLLAFCDEFPTGRGIDLLRSYQKMRQRFGPRSPGVIVCGTPSRSGVVLAGTPCRPEQLWAAEPGVKRAIAFVGEASEAHKAFLLHHCLAVVDLRSDGGPEEILAGHYLGKPAVALRDPVAEWYYDCFGASVRFFTLGQVEELSGQMFQAAQQPAPTESQMDLIRRQLTNPSLSVRSQAEHLLQALADLANRGSGARGETFLTSQAA